MGADKPLDEKSNELLQRVNIALFIQHPVLDPAEITARLGIEEHFSHKGGERIVTPTGTVMPGRYHDTRWRHSIRHKFADQLFAKQVTEFVQGLMPQKTFLHEIRETGGSESVIIQFLGDRYHGDNVPFETLCILNELQLDLGIEVYNVQQN